MARQVIYRLDQWSTSRYADLRFDLAVASRDGTVTGLLGTTVHATGWSQNRPVL